MVFFKGYIIQQSENKPGRDGVLDILITNLEFHPYPFLQNEGKLCKEFDSFDLAVDEFFSTLEGQKIDVKALQQVCIYLLCDNEK